MKLVVVAMWVCKNALERHEFTIAGCICARSLKHYAKMRNWRLNFIKFGRSVFWALFGAIYLCFGMPEVYRVLFEVFGLDPEDEECQPRKRRQLEDVDYVSAEFEGRKLSWQDVATYRV